ncbi:MAG: PqqD family protein [Oscillospiraceae bacterium]|nr:PqqD family protein [Oscillospiraceae bacterium]
MKRNENFILRRVADMTVIVPVGRETERFPGMISVNETGAFLWDLLETEQTLQTLAETLARQYDADPERARGDTEKFLEKLERAGALWGL